MRVSEIMIYLAAAVLLLAIPAAQAQDGIRTETVRFKGGQTGTVIQDQIRGYEMVSYQLGAQAGQVMRVSLEPSNLATYFNVYEPGRGPGDEALASGDRTSDMVPDLNRFEGVLPVSGTYTISVYMYRAAARRNERSNYSLEIEISAEGAAAQLPVVRDDYADGLEGGPDFWEVTGVGSGDYLNLREGPSTGAAVLARLANGTRLKNGGCRMASGQRWCRVETVNGGIVSGWVAGRYLREGG